MDLGKKVSSCAAVAIVWMGGAVLLQLIYMAAVTLLVSHPNDASEKQASESQLWLAAAMPLVVACGGTAAAWVLRMASGWPILRLRTLFLYSLIAAVFGLAALASGEVVGVAVATGVLGLAGAMVMTWKAVGHGELGTHMSPGATLTPAELPIGQSDTEKR